MKYSNDVLSSVLLICSYDTTVSLFSFAHLRINANCSCVYFRSFQDNVLSLALTCILFVLLDTYSGVNTSFDASYAYKSNSGKHVMLSHSISLHNSTTLVNVFKKYGLDSNGSGSMYKLILREIRLSIF